jgi:hypothetical protein
MRLYYIVTPRVGRESAYGDTVPVAMKRGQREPHIFFRISEEENTFFNEVQTLCG